MLLPKLPIVSSAMHLQDCFAKSATTITVSTFAKFGDLDKILPKLSCLPKYVKINYRQCFAVFVLLCISRHKWKYVLILTTLKPEKYKMANNFIIISTTYVI